MKINWKRNTGIGGGVVIALLAGLLAAGFLHDFIMEYWSSSISRGLKHASAAHPAPAAAVVFGEVQSHYTTSQVLRWSITNNGKEDLRYYCTVEAKEQDGWGEVDYSLEGDELSREKVTQQLLLRGGETAQRSWSLSKDADRLKYVLASTKTYRLRASFYVASEPPRHAIASVFSQEFELTPAPAPAPKP